MTKTAQQQDLDTEFKAFEVLKTKYDSRKWLGHIRWFDHTSGEGMIRLDSGLSIYVHFTAFNGIDNNNWVHPNTRDQELLKDIEGLRCSVIPAVFYGFGIMATKVELLTSDF